MNKNNLTFHHNKLQHRHDAYIKLREEFDRILIRGRHIKPFA